MRITQSLVFVVVLAGSAAAAAAQEPGPISRAMAREVSRLTADVAQSPQPGKREANATDKQWQQLVRHVEEKLIVSTRTNGELRGALYSAGSDAIDIESSGLIRRVVRTDVCDITTKERALTRNARWAFISGLSGLGGAFAIEAYRSLDRSVAREAFSFGDALWTGAAIGAGVGLLVASRQDAPRPRSLYVDMDRAGCP